MVAGAMLASFDEDDQMYTTSSTMSGAKRGSNLANIELQVTRDGIRKPALVDPGEDTEPAPYLIYMMSVLSAMGGFLFGYDTGIVSGAMVFVRKYFALDTVWQEVIVSITVLGAWILSILAGSLSERYGRKVIILLASVIFTFGSIIMGFAWSKWILLFGRLTVGVAIGLASTAVPVYIAEVAPSNIRGSLVTLNNCFITVGQLAAAVTAGIFSSDQESGWRWMLSLAAVPAAFQFAGFMFMPESPRWLIRKRRDEEAFASLQRMRGPKSARLHYEFENIKQSSLEAENQKARRKQQKRNMVIAILRKTASRRALVVGCLLMSIQQLAGINTVMYYSATIIQMSGVQSQSMAVWLVVPTAAVYVLFSFAGYLLADRIGRRTLTLGSLMGVIVALLVLGTGFHLTSGDSARVTVNNLSPNNTVCNKYLYCSGCITSSECGFCYEPTTMTAMCLRRDPNEPDNSMFGECSTSAMSSTAYSAMSSLVEPPSSITIANMSSGSKTDETIDGPILIEPLDPAMNGNHEQQHYKFTTSVCPQTTSDGIRLNTWLVVGGLVLYLAAFAPGMGPMPWTINSEIYPMWSRSMCYSMATSINWLFNMIVSFTFLTLTEALTTHGTFYMYSIISSIGWILLFWKLPETRGRSLEEVSSLFARQKPDNQDMIDTDNNSAASSGVNNNTGTNNMSTIPHNNNNITDEQPRAVTKRTAWIAQAPSSPTGRRRIANHRASTGQLVVGDGIRSALSNQSRSIIGHENMAYDSTDDDSSARLDSLAATDHDVGSTSGPASPGLRSPVHQLHDSMAAQHRRYSHNPASMSSTSGVNRQQPSAPDAGAHYYLPPPSVPSSSPPSGGQRNSKATTNTGPESTPTPEHLVHRG